MSNNWQEFLELLSEEELIRFTCRALNAGKIELAEQLEAKLEARRQTKEIHDVPSLRHNGVAKLTK